MDNESTTSIYFSPDVLKTRLRSSTLQRKSCSDVKNVEYKRPKLSVEVNSPLSDDATPVVEPVVGLQRYREDFYNVPCKELAKKLLGKVLVRRLSDDIVLKGRIVETECYLGGEDKASHSYGGRMTKGNKPMYMKPGTAYVYFTYGMYHCFNISSLGPGSCVLLRSIEPLEGLEHMRHLRKVKRKKKPESSASADAQVLKDTEICNGPAKLCISFDVGKENCNAKDLCCWDGMWIEENGAGTDIKLHNIVSCPRIGIDSAGVEWAQKPLRFYILDNNYVSRRNRVVEKQQSEVANISGDC